MDHSAHMQKDHSALMQMDHSMPGMPPDSCSMDMLFTWNWKNTCVIYKWWHVKTFPQFILTCFAIALLAAGYEFTKYWVSKLEKSESSTLSTYTNNNPNSPIVVNANQSPKWLKSLFYGFQVGYSFMLMLVFMTYNGWYMIATVVGAGLGHHFWSSTTEQSRTLACH